MNKPRRARGCDALVRTLEAAGVRRVFALSGNHIMPMFDAIFDSRIELVHTRHEASAVHMADAWARLTGEVGMALVTGGPGHANAVSALYTAQMAESPLILLSGHASNDQLGQGAFQEMRQAEMAAPVTKAAWTCASADQVAGDIAKAMRTARFGRPGPVHLSLPTDTLEAVAPVGTAAPSAFEPEPMPLAPETATELMRSLARAARPLILVGPASLGRSGCRLLAAFEAESGVPVVGMDSPRGIADPRLGAFAEVLAQADAVLLLGKRLDFTLGFGRAPAFPAGAEVFQVDPEPVELDRSRRALGGRLGACAVAAVPEALAALTRAATGRAGADWLAEVRAAVAYRPVAWEAARSDLAGRLHPVQMLRPLQALLDSHPDSVLVCDGGEIGQWAAACLNAPHRINNGVAGSIGSALPFALGARCAVPDAPIVAVMGDGTVGFHIAEYDTAVRHRLDFISVIGNDARWNAEYQIQLRDYGPDRLIGCELRPLRYDAVAQAFGAHGELVTTPGGMDGAVERAVASRRVACLNVMIEGLPAPVISR